MLYRLIYVVLIVFMFVLEACALDFPSETPHPKNIEVLSTTKIQISQNARLDIPFNIKQKYHVSVSECESVLKNLPFDGHPGTIHLKIVSSSILSSYITDNSKLNAFINSGEGYVIYVTGDGRISILSNKELGLLHGLTTMTGLLKNNNGSLPGLHIVDYPDIKLRIVHMTLHEHTTPDDAKKFINSARKAHFNTVQVLIKDGLKLDSMSKMYREDAWTKDEMKDFIKYANESGFDVIPEIKFLTHQESLFKDRYPSLMFNKLTYDPRNEETYKAVFPIIDEVIELFHPYAIHIGHDEVIGFNEHHKKKVLNPGEESLPAELFLYDVNRLNTYIKNKNVQVWMWGDALLDSSDKELQVMNPRHLHAFGSYASIRSKIPKNILICDWHYFDEQKEFPSVDVLMREGHDVVGISWFNCEIYKRNKDFIKPVILKDGYKSQIPLFGEPKCDPQKDTIANFSSYVYHHKAKGMMAGAFYHIRLGKKLIDDIIAASGEAFWNVRQ